LPCKARHSLKFFAWLCVRFCWHLNVAIGLFGLLVNREEMLFNTF
jgi:hypothetical protein